MTIRKATLEDIDLLVSLRLDFLTENSGDLTEDARLALTEQLPNYYRNHLNQDFFAYLTDCEGHTIACVFLLITERPAHPNFQSGKIGTIMNVHTHKNYRRRGYAKALLTLAIEDARSNHLAYLDLNATADGFPLYQLLGFSTHFLKDTPMRLTLQE